MANTTLNNDYKVVVEGELNELALKQVRAITKTIDLALFDRTRHDGLRINALSVRQDLAEINTRHAADEDSKNADWVRDSALQKRVARLIESYNRLDSKSLNRAALDAQKKVTNDNLPESKGDSKKDEEPDSKSEDKSDTTSTDNDEEKDSPTAIREELNELRKRVDGQERRHEENEANIHALNGAVGITKNNQNAWVPTPDGQFDRNAKVQEHLGYNWNKETNKATFADRGGRSPFPFNAPIAGLAGAIALVVLLLIFWLLVGMVFTVALFAATPIALFSAVIVGWLTADRNHN